MSGSSFSPPSPSFPSFPSSLFLGFRYKVHTVKPKKKDYDHDPYHRVNPRTGNTSNSRIVETRTEKVQSKLNNVSPFIQFVMCIMCTSVLQTIKEGGGGGGCGDGGCGDGGCGGGGCGGGGGGCDTTSAQELLNFLEELKVFCAFGKFHTAKKYRKYSELLGIPEEHVPGWNNKYNSQYISSAMHVSWKSFEALHCFLTNPRNIHHLSDTDVENIVGGFVCMSALPDSYFLCRESSTPSKKDFFSQMCRALQVAMNTLWAEKSHDKNCFTSNGGMSRDCYYNILDTYFSP